MENQRDPKKEPPSGDETSSNQEGESRREFIKKLPYIAPAVQTFLLSETAFGSDRRGGDEGREGGGEGGGDEGGEGGGGGGDEGGEGEGGDDEGRGRGRRQVSPHTRGRGRGRG